MNQEAFIHTLLCNFIRSNYPDVIFTSDLSGVRLPMGVAKKVKPLKSSRGIPDLLIFKPMNGYHGLLLELKTEDAKLFRKDGRGLLVDEHHAEQMQILLRLRLLGYAAFFARGIVNAKDCIQQYMALEGAPPRTALRSTGCEDIHPLEWVKCGKSAANH
jgi:hypothetical protein